MLTRRLDSTMSSKSLTPPPGGALLGKSLEGTFDLEETLRYTMNKRDEENHKVRQLGVMFKDLRVVGQGAFASYQSTIASVLNPLNLLKTINAIRHPPTMDILSGFEGVVRPGEMLLVLGRPGSGCSTLLKTLANQRDEYLAVEGIVNYDSFSPEEVAKHYRGDVTYCPEDDVHFPTLTVDQTLRFAAKTRTPRQRLQNQTRDQFVSTTTDVLTAILGLQHAKKTPVGDVAIHGVSGGEKKRVSIAEAMAARGLLAAWDNSTRGLDASTALELIRTLRISTDIYNLSTIVSIHQAADSLYRLFDKVCVIYEGKMAYFGPANKAKQYFIDMGYEPANRQTTADFLVATTDPLARIERPLHGTTSPIPRMAAEFVAHFKTSPFAALNREDMASYHNEFVGRPKRVDGYKASVRAEHSKHVWRSSAYMVSIPMQIRAVMMRQVQIMYGNSMALLFTLLAFIIQGIIAGSVFLRVPEHTAGYYSRGGIIFFALLFSALTSMSEIPTRFSQRPIVLRHQKAALYHPFIEAVALTLVDIPITFAMMLVFAMVIYEMVQLQQSFGQFFVFFLFLFVTSLTMKAWFRALAASFKSEASTQAMAGLSLLVVVLYTGYAIPKPYMIGALRWIMYINPVRYSFEALITNEFHTLNGTCSSLVPHGNGYENIGLENQVCTTIGSQTGRAFVSGDNFVGLSFGFSYDNLWHNFGVVIAFGIMFTCGLLFFTEYNAGLSGEIAVTLFKHESKTYAINETPSSTDEKTPAGGRNGVAGRSKTKSEVVKPRKPLPEAPAMTNIFSWQHIEYTIPLGKGEHRRLLNDVTGYVAPGKLTALMGESGAGKTTLLNALAQRIDTGVMSGNLLIDGQPIPVDFPSQIGYVQQMDTHVPTATVREALLFSAKLRQPTSVSLSEKKAYVETCLRMCGLEAYGDAIVGSLDTEHRKRTTIGVELAAKPKLLLFLDEPTSGLDSQSAWAIMLCLRSLANNGQAILCTIHQPPAELFQIFDRLLLLRTGGETVYFGDIGPNSTILTRYFEQNGSRTCAPEENPAEFMLEVIGAGAMGTSEQDWHNIWKCSKEAKEVQQEVDTIHMNGPDRPLAGTSQYSEFATSWGYQVVELMRRNAQRHWRDPTYLMAKLTLNTIGGLFIGFTFFKSKESLQAAQNKLFAIYMGTILSVPLSNQLQIPFLNMRSIYEIRERPSRMYSWTAMVTSLFLTELPWNILGSSLFFLCWYWTVGLANDRAGFTYLLLGVTFPLYYTSISMAVAAMTPNTEIAALVFSFLVSFALTFNGVLQPHSQLGWWQWMYYLSPYTYLIGGLLGQAIGKQNITCTPVELVTLTPPPGQTCGSYMLQYISSTGGYLNNPNASSACEFCPVRTTDDFLGPYFNIEYSQYWRDFGIVMAFTAFNVFCLYLFTYFFRIRTGSLFGSIRKHSKGKK